MRGLLSAFLVCLTLGAASAQDCGPNNPNCIIGSPTSLPLFQQGGSGAVNRTVFSKISDWLNAKDFGVACDGSTVDTADISAAITAANAAAAGTSGIVGVQLPSGVCVIGGGATVAMKSNVWLKGAGQGATTLRYLSSNGTHNGIQFASTGSNMYITDLTMDGGDFLDINNMIFLGNTVSDVAIERVSLVKIGTFGFALQGATRFRIADNYCSLTVARNSQNECLNISGAVQSTQGVVEGNQFVNSGFLFSGSQIQVLNNNISAMKYGCGVGNSADTYTHDNVIAHNILDNGSGTDTDGTKVCGIETWGARTVIDGNSVFHNSGIGISVGGQDSIITNNVAYDNGQTANDSGLVSRYSDATYNANNSIYIGNKSFNTNGGAGTQAYGYLEASSSLAGIRLIGNNFSTNATGTVDILSSTTQHPLWPAGTHTLAGLDVAQAWTAAQTFANSDLLLLGSSTGYTTFTSANAGGSNYTLTFPALTANIITSGDTGTVSNTMLAGSIAPSQLLVGSKAWSTTAPTIASGFCSTASNTTISASNGTAAFDILIGGATCGSTGTLTMPAATTGWVCESTDVTTPASHNVVQTGTQGSTTAVVLTDYARTTGIAQNFNPGDHIHVMCTGY